MSFYPHAIRRNIAPGPNDPRITPRVVILHIAVSEAASLHGYFNGPSGGVESHFYVRRDGTVEQYRDTHWQADANTDANNFAISIETQGMEHGEWTAEQMAAIKNLIRWCHDEHGIPLEVPQSWDGSGVGYHVQFPGRWDRRGATCPGPDRQRQYWDDLVPWLGGRGGGAQSVEFEVPQPRPSTGFKPLWTPTGKLSVRQIQRIVGATVDGLYGAGTLAKVKAYQRDELKVTADGLWGKGTESAHFARERRAKRPRLRNLKRGSKGRRVRNLQAGLNRAFPAYSSLVVDGIFGKATERVVREFQRRSGLSVDAVVGPATRKALSKYGIKA